MSGLQRKIDLTKMRVFKIREYIVSSTPKILEIGALDWPTFIKPEFDVSYVDYASRTELAKKSPSNLRYAYDNIVDVDYVIPSPPYASIINEKFDVIIANHVIEHIPNVIDWLNDLGKLLHSNGVIFLSIPDKRYTFDYLRRESTIFDLVRSFKSKQKKPDFVNIIEHLWYKRNIKCQDVWGGKDLMPLLSVRPNFLEVYDVAEKASMQAYADVHCNVFTADSFDELVNTLIDLKFIGFSGADVSKVIVDHNEFHVVLKDFSLESIQLLH